MSKSLFLLCLVALTGTARAEVIEVFTWDPIASVPNSTPQLFQNALEAKAIQEKHGAVVRASRNQFGQLSFSLSHESYAAMNKFYTSLNADPANDAFWQLANANPIAKQIGAATLDVIAAGKRGPVADVFVWEPMPGRLDETIQNAIGAKAIHEKTGVGVTVAADRLNRMIYIVSYDSFEDYAKFWDTPNQEFNDYMANLNEDPSAKLVATYHLTPAPN